MQIVHYVLVVRNLRYGMVCTRLDIYIQLVIRHSISNSRREHSIFEEGHEVSSLDFQFNS